MSNNVSETLHRKEISQMSDSGNQKKIGKNRLNTGIHKESFMT